jgi:hypothetical protein
MAGVSKRGGRREGAGRKKGVPNKINSELKEAILAALNEVGGVDYLVEKARENPVAFLALLGRILPLTVAGDPKKPIGHVHEIKIRIVDPPKPEGAYG